MVASGDDGLEVFGASATQTMAMDGASAHSWPVNFRAESDGVYYLNVYATADPGGQGIATSRAYAVRIEVGDISQGKPLSINGEITTLPDGENAVIMQAEEVVE